MSDERAEELGDQVSEIFGQIVTLDVINEQMTDDAGVVICNMTYLPSGASQDTHRTRVRQSAVVLNADDLDLPKFTLSPEHTGGMGVTGKLLSLMGGFGDINFSDSPEFSSAYCLQAWAEEPVRILFNRRVRDYFEKNTEWCVRGQGRQLVVFRKYVVIEESKLPKFVNKALEILSVLREAESELDARPDVRRDITGDDLLKAGDRMGILGAALKSQYKKISVTQEELDEFHAAPPPRALPAGLKRQVVGDNLPLVFIGMFFFVAGIVAGSLILAFGKPSDHLVAGLFMSFMPLTGGIMAGATIFYRRKKIRLLRDGLLTRGRVTKVSATDTIVNSQVRHLVYISYDADGSERTTTCNAYSTAADRARRLKTTGETVNILVDPKDPNHVTCTDFLLLFSS